MEIVWHGKSRRQYEKRRFWELFNPSTINFGFWLASASFSFFVYQSLSLSRLEGVMSWTTVFLSYFFLGFGTFCVLIVAYLGVSWLFGFRIQKKRTKEEELLRMKALLNEVTSELETLKKRIAEVENDISTKSK